MRTEIERTVFAPTSDSTHTWYNAGEDSGRAVHWPGRGDGVVGLSQFTATLSVARPCAPVGPGPRTRRVQSPHGDEPVPWWRTCARKSSGIAALFWPFARGLRGEASAAPPHKAAPQVHVYVLIAPCARCAIPVTNRIGLPRRRKEAKKTTNSPLTYWGTGGYTVCRRETVRRVGLWSESVHRDRGRKRAALTTRKVNRFPA
jgi:hypothetical protein